MSSCNDPRSLLVNANWHVAALLDADALKRQMSLCWRRHVSFASATSSRRTPNFVLVYYHDNLELKSEVVNSIAKLKAKKPALLLVPRSPRWLLVLFDSLKDSSSLTNGSDLFPTTFYSAALLRDFVVSKIEEHHVEERLVSSVESLAKIVSGDDEDDNSFNTLDDGGPQEMVVFNTGGVYACATEIYGGQKNPHDTGSHTEHMSVHGLVKQGLRLFANFEPYYELVAKFARSPDTKKVLKIFVTSAHINAKSEDATQWPTRIRVPNINVI